MSFGNDLKAAREGLGLSIQDVAQSTKIRSDYLKALEAEEFSALPERPFARSYLQNFARELRIDSAPLLRDFDRQVPVPKMQVQRPEPRPARGSRTAGVPLGLVGGLLGGGLLLGLVGYVGYTAFQSRTVHRAPGSVASVPGVVRQVRLDLSSTPSGARVYVDNRYLGLTPVQRFPLDARARGVLRVEYGGRQIFRQSVALTADRHLSVTLLPETAASRAAEKLAAGQAAAGAAAPNTVTPNAAAPAASTSAPRPPVTTSPAATTGKPPPTVGTANSAVASTPPASGTPASPAAGSVPGLTPPPLPVVKGIRLSYSGASWTRVTTSGGQLLYEGTPAAGSTRDFPSGVTVRVGSAGAVKVSVSGGPLSPLGSVGQVVTRKF